MNNENIFKDFVRYVFLNILSQMAYACYTMADTFFVSINLGTNSLTALNLAFPMFCIINGIGLMIGMGGGTQYSILKSRGEDAKANRIFTNAAYLVAGFAAIFFIAGLFFSKPLVRLLGADDTVFTMTHTYLRVMLLFAPAFLTNNLLQCFVRNDGNPSLSTAAMTTGCLSNIVLDYIFIFPLHMGIFGAIFATGLSPIISMTVLSPYFIQKKNQFHLAVSRPYIKNMQTILSSGIPPFLTEATSGIVMFLFNFIILRLEGNVGVAAFGIVSLISLVVVAMYTGLSQGIQPIISRNHGARHEKNVKRILKYALITMAMMSAIIYTIIYFGASPITAVFNSEHNQVLQAFAIVGLRFYFIACPFIGLNIVLATYFTSTERPVPAQMISLLRGIILLVPMAFLLSSLFKMNGVWCAYPLTECMVACIGIILYIRSEKKIS